MPYMDLIKQRWRELQFSFIHTFLSASGQTIIIAVFVPYILIEYGLTNKEFGFLYSILTVLSAVAINIWGPFIDRMSIKYYTLINSVFIIFAFICLYYFKNIWILCLSLFLVRFVGQGLFGHTGATSTNKNFSKHRGAALSIMVLGRPIGEGLLPIILLYLMDSISWREAWLALAMIVAFCILISVVFYPSSDSVKKKVLADNIDSKQNPSLLTWTRKQALQNKMFYLLVPSLTVPAFVLTGIFLYQAKLSEFKGWPENWIAQSIYIFSMARLAIYTFIGPLIDKFKPYIFFRLYLIPALTALLLFFFVPQSVSIVFIMVLMGISVGISMPMSDSLLSNIYGTQHIGAIRSTSYSIVICSTALSTFIFGLFIDSENPLLWTSSISIGVTLVSIFLANLAMSKRNQILNIKP